MNLTWISDILIPSFDDQAKRSLNLKKYTSNFGYFQGINTGKNVLTNRKDCDKTQNKVIGYRNSEVNQNVEWIKIHYRPFEVDWEFNDMILISSICVEGQKSFSKSTFKSGINGCLKKVYQRY